MNSTKTIAITISTATAVAAIAASLYYFIKSRRNTIENEQKQSDKVVTSIQTLELPVVNLDLLLNFNTAPELLQAECERAAEALHKYGILIVRDPRVHERDNNQFLDLMERYFEFSDGVRDARPEYGYQVGVTPENRELPRNHCARMKQYNTGNEPLSLCPPEFDPKWRFFWRIGERPKKSVFMTLNPEPVVPPEFPEWEETMNMWGNKMLDALKAAASMISQGLGLDPSMLPKMMEKAPHLLAPTGSNFNKYGKLHTVLAGFHYDLNFLTIHGKSRYPGLYLWTREGKKISVKIPDGCLLIQAGKQIEYLTAGYILAGFHEVVVSPETVRVFEDKKQNGGSLWRVSSTCFGHIASDTVLEPLGRFRTEENLHKYPPILTGQQVIEELDAISLGKGFSSRAL